MEGDRNPATTKRKFSEDSVSSSDDDLPLLKRAKRLAAAKTSSSATNARNPATTSKRKLSQVVPLSDDDLRQSKRLASSSATSIHDIPNELLVEILCRLPCAKSIFRCKSVSKTWLSLTSDPSFIGRFLWLQRHNQTLIPGTIINQTWGNELLNTDLFARFRSFRTEENERLEVLATWNDLVLCKSLFQDDGQYYICNPRTMRSKDQLVTLPPIHQRGEVAVGFMCEPYYKEEEDDRHADNSTDQKEGDKRKVIRIDAEYKFKVVRILAPENEDKLCFEFRIQVFSNEIGEWRESLVSCPRGFIFSELERCGFASNGMLYWKAEKDGDLLGLGPLMFNNKSTPTCSNSTTTTTTANGDLGYQFHVIKLVDRHEHPDLCSSLYHLQGHRGRLQLVRVMENENVIGARLFVWELEKEELEQMAVQGGGELGQKHRNIYSLMEGVPFWKYTSQYNCLECFGSDPNDLDTCFVSLTDPARSRKEQTYDDYIVIYKCNIHTGECSKMKMDKPFSGKALQIMLPWWPTPAPRIRSHKAETPSEQVIQ